MTEKVLCPYCGSEMEYYVLEMSESDYVGYMGCMNTACASTGPATSHIKTEAEAKIAALAAAQARYLPPNRPLTLDEVKHLEMDESGRACCFVEIEPNEYRADSDNFEPRLYAGVIWPEISDDDSDYGGKWRAWLRKPTQAEMGAAGWGDAK